MGDAAPDSEPPSGAALAISLGRGEAAGMLAAHDAYGPDLIGYAEFLLTSQPADTEAHLGDEAADAVLDALLAATGAVGDLTDPDRLRGWLLALTRNECLRRRPGSGSPSAAEAAELGRRGLGPVDVAALLGFAPADLPSRVPAVETVPAWLRAELTAAAGPENAPRRGALTRRARPFEPDGFPVPLDRRRLSGKVLAWSAAVVVLVALALLVALPTWGSAGAAARQDPVLAAGSGAVEAAPAEAADDPLPTLADAPFGSTPEPTTPLPAAGADDTPTAPATTAARPTASTRVVPTTEPPARPEAQVDAGTADRGSRGTGALSLSWTPAAGLVCGDRWTAELHVSAGGAEVSRVIAVPGHGPAVGLRRDGDGWSGELTGLPTNRTVTVTVFADGAVRPASARLTVDC